MSFPADQQDDSEPITVWIDQLRMGDSQATNRVWFHFVDKLRNSLRSKIHPDTKRVYDEDDAAQSAFMSLCKGLGDGRYPNISDRRSLWSLLLVIALRKLSNRHRYDHRMRRDNRRTISLQSTENENGAFEANLFEQAKSLTPDLVAEFQETWQILFQRLGDPMLQQICEMKLEGYTDREIAQRFDLTDRTIRRKVESIRRVWKRELSD